MAGDPIDAEKQVLCGTLFLGWEYFTHSKLLFIDFRPTTIYAEAQCPPSTRKSAPVMNDEPSASK
jgi:hypothetical protein